MRVGDEEQLEEYLTGHTKIAVKLLTTLMPVSLLPTDLHNCDGSSPKDQNVLHVCVHAESASDDVEGGVSEDAAGRKDQQVAAQNGLLLTMEAELLNSVYKRSSLVVPRKNVM